MNPSRTAAKYRQIAQVLAQRIRAGAYDENGLPGERELATEFAVARVTVRNALHALQDLGLVTRKERRGTLAISGAGAPRPRRLLRELVDQFLDRGRIDQRRVLAFGFVRADKDVAESLAVAEGTRVLRVVRVRSIGLQPLTYTEVFVPERIGRQVTRDALEKKPYVQVLEALGVKLGDAEQLVAAEATPAAIAAALGVEAGAPVLKLHRVLYESTGMPIQLLLGWYRADQFDIAMRMSRSDDSTRVWVRVR
ncbi:MAG: GntR family transcriptional regulator [Variovorax sp.]